MAHTLALPAGKTSITNTTRDVARIDLWHVSPVMADCSIIVYHGYCPVATLKPWGEDWWATRYEWAERADSVQGAVNAVARHLGYLDY